ILDRIWFGWEQGIPSKKIAEVLELTEENVDSIIRDTQRKIRTTEYLRMEPL
ncbi:MAG: NAD(+) synthase, partial [Ignavibacteriae bacterium]|nr:NAD(+) synthase [Ignavibacteriota bacterium]